MQGHQWRWQWWWCEGSAGHSVWGIYVLPCAECLPAASIWVTEDRDTMQGLLTQFCSLCHFISTVSTFFAHQSRCWLTQFPWGWAQALFGVWRHSVSSCWWTVPPSPASWADETACCFLLVSYHLLSLKERPCFNFNLCWYMAVKGKRGGNVRSVIKATAFLTALRFTPSLGRFQSNDVVVSMEEFKLPNKRHTILQTFWGKSQSSFPHPILADSQLNILNLDWDILGNFKAFSTLLKFVVVLVFGILFCFSISFSLKRSISPRVIFSCSLHISIKLDQEPNLLHSFIPLEPKLFLNFAFKKKRRNEYPVLLTALYFKSLKI